MEKQENNWKKLKSETVYENPWIKVEHHLVINPAGNEGIYGQVNFKNIAIGIIPIADNLDTWLVGQFRFPTEAYSWEIPEGGCPVNENELDAAKRELLEETGIVAKKWTLISQIHTSNSVCNEFGLIYMAEELSFQAAEPEETEVLKLKKVSLKKAYEMVMNNEITDSISIAGILKAAVLKKVV